MPVTYSAFHFIFDSPIGGTLSLLEFQSMGAKLLYWMQYAGPRRCLTYTLFDRQARRLVLLQRVRMQSPCQNGITAFDQMLAAITLIRMWTVQSHVVASARRPASSPKPTGGLIVTCAVADERQEIARRGLRPKHVQIAAAGPAVACPGYFNWI